MAVIYKHGTYGEYADSIGAAPARSDTVAVYVGTAPVNLVPGYAEKGLVNKPISISTYEGALGSLGYSSDWENFTLCEAIKAHFNNTLGNAAPVIFINVLDPAVHKAAEQETTSLSFVNGSAVIDSDKIILDSITVADKTKGTDYDVTYNYTKGQAVISSIGSTPLSGSLSVTYDEIDTSAIDSDDIIGGVTSAGVYTGLGCVDLIYQTYNLIPSILAAPGWSEDPDVYAAMLVKASKINGHWDAFVVADIPLNDTSTVNTIALAKTWQSTNGYTNANSKVCWPQVKSATGEIYHLSTLCTWQMMLTDASHDGVPMETPSNKELPVVSQYFGSASTNAGFDQTQGNELNAAGITTAVFWGGRWVLWGPHTAAYSFGMTDDAKNIFDNNVRMMMYVSNSFQREHALTIDKPMTRALADTIRNREQQKADALAAVGAFIGAPTVEFREAENSTDELVEGNFVWSFAGTPTPPFKSGTIKVAYTSAGFETFYEEV